jgi:hypothetical protein
MWKWVVLALLLWWCFRRKKAQTAVASLAPTRVMPGGEPLATSPLGPVATILPSPPRVLGAITPALERFELDRRLRAAAELTLVPPPPVPTPVPAPVVAPSPLRTFSGSLSLIRG